jgi:hypothetical protein
MQRRAYSFPRHGRARPGGARSSLPVVGLRAGAPAGSSADAAVEIRSGPRAPVVGRRAAAPAGSSTDAAVEIRSGPRAPAVGRRAGAPAGSSADAAVEISSGPRAPPLILDHRRRCLRRPRRAAGHEAEVDLLRGGWSIHAPLAIRAAPVFGGRTDSQDRMDHPTEWRAMFEGRLTARHRAGSLAAAHPRARAERSGSLPGSRPSMTKSAVGCEVRGRSAMHRF